MHSPTESSRQIIAMSSTMNPRLNFWCLSLNSLENMSPIYFRLGSGRVKKVQRVKKKYTDILVIWTRIKSCGTIFFIREKTCARNRSHIEALGSNTRDIGVLFSPAVLFFLPALILCQDAFSQFKGQGMIHHLELLDSQDATNAFLVPCPVFFSFFCCCCCCHGVMPARSHYLVCVCTALHATPDQPAEQK